MPLGARLPLWQVGLMDPLPYLAERPAPFWALYHQEHFRELQTAATRIDEYKALFLPLHEEVRSHRLLHIFQVNRCGSTLLLNMLARIPELACFNEHVPWMQDDDFDMGIERDDDLNRCIGTHIACWAEEHARTVVLKYVAETTVLAQSLVDLFPGSRGLFLYRHPAAVIDSQRRGPPMSFPGKVLTDIGSLAPTMRRWDPDLPARILAASYLDNVERYRRAASSEAGAQRLRCLRYESFLADPRGMLGRCLEFFGIDVGAARIEEMLEELAFDAKPRAGGERRPFVASRGEEDPYRGLSPSMRDELEALWAQRLPGDLEG